MDRRWPWALALLVVSPVCAEYLWGYDDTTGDALVLLVAAGIGAFWSTPLGDVPDVAKYAHNAALLLFVAVLIVTAVRRTGGVPKR